MDAHLWSIGLAAPPRAQRLLHLLYRQFFRGIPDEIYDSARIDGCSEFGVWLRIFMPMSRPVLAAVSIFAFSFAWNDFLNPLIYLGSNQELWTLALGLNALKGFEGNENSLNMLMTLLDADDYPDAGGLLLRAEASDHRRHRFGQPQGIEIQPLPRPLPEASGRGDILRTAS